MVTKGSSTEVDEKKEGGEKRGSPWGEGKERRGGGGYIKGVTGRTDDPKHISKTTHNHKKAATFGWL